MALKNLLNPRSSSRTTEELRATLGEHLEELRKRIISVAFFFALASTVGWFLRPMVFVAFDRQIKAGLPKNIELKEALFNVPEGFLLALRLSVWIGLILTLPWVIYHLWGFVKPGLKPSEIRPMKVIFPISVVLFAIGAGLGWFIIPPTMGWFLSFNADYPGVEQFANVRELIFLCAKLILAFGLSFQLPLVTFFLTRVGIVSPDYLMRYWKHSTVAVFIAAAVFTPSGDPITMAVMAVPLTLLFFGSVVAAKMSSKKDAKNKLDELNDLD